jgi:hypothetical protein
MSPEQASFIVPISVCSTAFVLMYINILLAKKKVREWKRHSTFFFVNSTGMGGVKRRASLVWMKRLGYEEAEALILAKCQSRVIFQTFVGGIVVMLIEGNSIIR